MIQMPFRPFVIPGVTDSRAFKAAFNRCFHARAGIFNNQAVMGIQANHRCRFQEDFGMRFGMRDHRGRICFQTEFIQHIRLISGVCSAILPLYFHGKLCGQTTIKPMIEKGVSIDGREQ